MNTRSLLLVPLAAALAFAGTATAQAVASPDGQQALAALQSSGYAEVRELEYDDGVWEAEIRRADGRWGEVALDPANGEVFDAMTPRQLLPLQDVLAAIEAAGFQQVHDLDRDGALWDADAIGPDGQPMELRISGYDGRIVSSRVDHDD